MLARSDWTFTYTGIPGYDTSDTSVVDTSCHRYSGDPFMQSTEERLIHGFCINENYQSNKVEVIPGMRKLEQTTRLTLKNDKSYDFKVIYQFDPDKKSENGSKDDLSVYIYNEQFDKKFDWVRDGSDNIGSW